MNGGERARAEGNEGEREVDLAGGGAEAERRAGRVGERPEEAGGAGALILPVAGEGVRRGLPLFRPRSGEQGRGRAGEVGWAGGRPSRARGLVGGRAFSFFSFPLSVLFSVFFLFVYFLFCFISFKSI